MALFAKLTVFVASAQPVIIGQFSEPHGQSQNIPVTDEEEPVNVIDAFVYVTPMKVPLNWVCNPFMTPVTALLRMLREPWL